MRLLRYLGLSAATAVTAALLCAAPAVAAVPVPFWGNGHPPYPIGREQVFSLVAHQTQFSFVDVGTSGPSQGDEFVISGDLLQGSAVVGHYGEVCTLTRVGPVVDSFDQQCVGTLTLPDGDLTIQGLISVTAAGPEADINLAITGGTGRYRTAHGFIHAVPVNATDTGFTVHLIR
ncbi:allene oxide cyclase barrel-like domain-containing protein [Streptomyces sp. BRA346]|uniref:allene oxide cyclase barrel-like domain-containing protein n=1 Tax=Streptomyces sp. BRA346 TaxID=2878199 RepID=UPI0040633C48